MSRDKHLPEPKLEPVQPGSTAGVPAEALPSDSVEEELLDLKQAALQYAARGISVFPLHNPNRRWMLLWQCLRQQRETSANETRIQRRHNR